MNRLDQEQEDLVNLNEDETQEGEEVLEVPPDLPEALALCDTDADFAPDWEESSLTTPDPIPPALSQKDNFIERFIYLQGKTDVPRIFFRFVALSLVSAVLQNKVWVELSPGNPLYPNLYVFLIGPSGVGKGQAIGAGNRLLESCGLTDYCGTVGGSLTSAGLVDFLASKKGSLIPSTSRAYVISAELASSIKWGEQADALIKRMTDFYTADLSSFTDLTRGGGAKKVGKPCVSWLAGSTRSWLVSNLKADALGGGFMARGLFVEVFGKSPNVFLPVMPPNYNEVFVELQMQLVSRIQPLEGKFTLRSEAFFFLKDWYMGRIVPDSEAGKASWNRHRELALKIAMILCASEPNPTKIITRDHLYEAISLVEEVKSTESTLWSFILRRGKTSDIDYIASVIKKKGTVDHSTLLNNAAVGRGIMARRLWDITDTLEKSGKIRSSRKEKLGVRGDTLRGRLIYSWVESRPSLVTEIEDE